ncbi:hypothetical protein NPIL_277491 [Nephila pilipes]|uniref:Uncharacterized protein n=1 Tax=Nephila pilipes TaxID=299642 RepID=A0A8X6R3Y9_NEPPI|nr:hypothetical protein NPIL_277491 [Nephila pilipes]
MTNIIQPFCKPSSQEMRAGVEVTNNGMMLTGFLRPKKSCLQKFRNKTILVAFFDCNRMIHQKFVSKGQTVNAEYYEAIRKLLLLHIQRVHPQMYKR